MKTILVATDFTPASHNACVYGAALAQAFNGRLVLFNAYQQLPVPVANAPVILPPEAQRAIAQEELEKEAKDINLWNTVTVETICREGVAVDNILKVIQEKNIDVLITGIKSAGKGFRKILGSTVTAVIRKTHIPVIAVPEEARFTRIDTIALANESDLAPDQDVHVMDALREVAEKFQPKLYLVRIAKNRFEEAFDVLNPPFQLQRMMKAHDPVYQCIEGRKVTEVLNSFIESYKVNMLALLPHKHSLLDRWFTKSTTRSMVFKTHIPLLILPGKIRRSAGAIDAKYKGVY